MSHPRDGASAPVARPVRGTRAKESADTGLPSPQADAELTSDRSRGRRLDVSLLGLVVVAITGFNLLWVWRDSDRLYWDFARHLGDSLVYKDAFSLSDPLNVLDTYVRYPPFTYWVTDAFYAFLGTELWVAILSNIVFLSIIVFATYGIGKMLWSRRVGLLSALVVVTSPMFVTHFKEYMLDAPLSAMVALALYFLIRSDHFADRRSSLLFGAALGLGFLTKWTFGFFLALPVIVSALTGLALSRRDRAPSRLFNVAGAGFLTLALSALWYLPHYHTFREDVSSSTAIPGSVQGSPPLGSLSSALWYFWNLVNNELYLIPFLFFVAGVIFILRKDESAARNSPLILSIVCSYIALTLIEIKDFRHTMPMLPAVAVVATSWLEHLRPKFRNWLNASLATYSVLAFFVISFGTGLLPKDITIPLKARSFTSDLIFFGPPESVRVTGIVVFAQHGFIVSQPSKQKWHEEEVFKEIAARGKNRTFGYYAGPETIWFNTWDARYYALRYGATWVGSPQAAEFLIIRGTVPSGVTTGFARVKQFPLPYRGPLTLYQRV